MTPAGLSPARVHPTAVVEDAVVLGAGTSVWDNVHIRRGARIGEECIIGDKTHIAYDVRIGNRVKIGAFANICPGVTVEDGVFIAMGVIFTNDLFPRATTPDLRHLLPSEPDERTLATRVGAGASIGANTTVRGGVEIGRWAMVGMAALVTRSVAPFHLVIGAPARPVGAVCRCGELVLRFPAQAPGASADVSAPDVAHAPCPRCGLAYALRGGQIIELAPPE